MSDEIQKSSRVLDVIIFGVIPVFFLLLPVIFRIAAYFMPADSPMREVLETTAVQCLVIIKVVAIFGGGMIVIIKIIPETLSLRARWIVGFGGLGNFVLGVGGVCAVRFGSLFFWCFLGMAFMGVASLWVALLRPSTPEPADTD